LNSKEYISKLPKAPLQEVIFELFLNQSVDSNGNPREDDFDLAQGVFHKLISADFSHRIIRNYPSDIKIFPRIKYQYWKKENEWPVVQIGPGLLTVNDTEKNYEWDNYYDLILSTIDKLLDSYSNQININRISLRYIDAVDLDFKSSNEKLEFINQNFKINLINNFSLEPAKLSRININQTYTLPDSSNVNFTISDGKSKNNKSAVVWQSQVLNSNVKSTEDIKTWLNMAHSITHDLFTKTIKDEFYEQFK